MKYLTAMLVLLFSVLFMGSCLAATAAAPASPSFECGTKLSAVEALICSNSTLAQLDSEMAKTFSAAKAANKADAAFLIADQRKWLKGREQHCQSKTPEYCINDYKERIIELSHPEFLLPPREATIRRALTTLRAIDGYEDLEKILTESNREAISKMSCRLFEKDPKAAHRVFASFADYRLAPFCDDIDVTDRVPEMGPFREALGTISGFGCCGSLDYTYARLAASYSILAAVDPNPLSSKENKQRFSYLARDKKQFGYSPDLKHWSQQGHWEKRQYATFLPLKQRAQKALQRYYRTRFGVSKRQAKEAAAYYIKALIVTTAGRTGKSSDSVYMSGCFNTQDVDAYLKTGHMPAKKCPSDEYNDTSKAAILRKLLGLAIVNDYSPSVVKRLIADGARINTNPAEDFFDTPLMLAAPYPKVMALLLEAGANVNTPNTFGKTALMYAIQEQNSESVSLLIQAHADVNAKTIGDTYHCLPSAGHRTPLMYAAWQSSPEIIRLLIQAHADITAKDTNGETAFDYLKRNKAPDSAQRAALEKQLKQ